MRATSTPDPLPNCPWCDYALEGLPVEHRCPECGHAFDRRLKLLGGAPLWRRMNRQGKWVAGISLAGNVVFVIYLLATGFSVFSLLLLLIPFGSLFWRRHYTHMRASPQFILAGPAGIQVCDRNNDNVECYPWATFTEAEARDGGVQVTLESSEVFVHAPRSEAKAFAELLHDYKDDWEDEHRAANDPNG